MHIFFSPFLHKLPQPRKLTSVFIVYPQVAPPLSRFSVALAPTPTVAVTAIGLQLCLIIVSELIPLYSINMDTCNML